MSALQYLCPMCSADLPEREAYCRACGEFVVCDDAPTDDDPPLSPAVAALARVYAGKFRAAEQAQAAARRNAAVAGYCAALLQRQEARR